MIGNYCCVLWPTPAVSSENEQGFNGKQWENLEGKYWKDFSKALQAAQEGTLSSETVFQSSTCIRALAYLLHIDYLLQYDFTNLRNI